MSIDPIPQSPYSLDALCIGEEPSALRSAGGSGRVIAVLRNAVYLESDDGHIISIVAGEVDSPLTVRITDITPIVAALAPRSKAPFRVTADTLQIAGAPGIRWTLARHWSPELPHLLGAPGTRLHAAHVLAQTLTGIGNEEGCGPVAAHLIGARHAVPLHAVSSRVLSSFNGACDTLQKHGYAEAAAMLVPLLGLGPGLTPSGDDLLGGIVASLLWRGRPGNVIGELAQALVEAIRTAAPSRTNRISARLLWYACRGQLYSPALRLGAALLQGDADAIPEAVRHLSTIGNTTGVDLAVGLLIGALLGLECDRIAYTDIGIVQSK